jgi:hypothetical protein
MVSILNVVQVKHMDEGNILGYQQLFHMDSLREVELDMALVK